MNILNEANKIVNERAEEKERQYGPFSKSMEKTAKVFSELTGKELTTEEAFLFMVVHKLVRQSNCHKEDNLLDACAYIGGLNNYINDKSHD